MKGKLQQLTSELEVGLPDVVALLTAQPLVWAINTVSIVGDRCGGRGSGLFSSGACLIPTARYC